MRRTFKWTSDFWERILPKQLNPTAMVHALEMNEAELTADTGKSDGFRAHLTGHVEEVSELRQSDSIMRYVIKLVTLVANKTNILDCANFIENPWRLNRRAATRRKRSTKTTCFCRSRNIIVYAQTKQTVYKTHQFTLKEMELLTKFR